MTARAFPTTFLAPTQPFLARQYSRGSTKLSREIVVGAGQLGPIARDEPRGSAVVRMIALPEKAAARGCHLVVFPELALTTFFPRWFMTDQTEIDSFFENEMPNEATQPLFDRACELRIGYAERPAPGNLAHS